MTIFVVVSKPTCATCAVIFFKTSPAFSGKQTAAATAMITTE
jgi:hypothetical protein